MLRGHSSKINLYLHELCSANCGSNATRAKVTEMERASKQAVEWDHYKAD